MAHVAVVDAEPGRPGAALHQTLKLFPVLGPQKYIPSPRVTWKLIEGALQRMVVFEGAPLNFHVNVEEFKVMAFCFL